MGGGGRMEDKNMNFAPLETALEKTNVIFMFAEQRQYEVDDSSRFALEVLIDTRSIV